MEVSANVILIWWIHILCMSTLQLPVSSTIIHFGMETSSGLDGCSCRGSLVTFTCEVSGPFITLDAPQFAESITFAPGDMFPQTITRAEYNAILVSIENNPNAIGEAIILVKLMVTMSDDLRGTAVTCSNHLFSEERTLCIPDEPQPPSSGSSLVRLDAGRYIALFEWSEVNGHEYIIEVFAALPAQFCDQVMSANATMTCGVINVSSIDLCKLVSPFSIGQTNTTSLNISILQDDPIVQSLQNTNMNIDDFNSTRCINVSTKTCGAVSEAYTIDLDYGGIAALLQRIEGPSKTTTTISSVTPSPSSPLGSVTSISASTPSPTPYTMLSTSSKNEGDLVVIAVVLLRSIFL